MNLVDKARAEAHRRWIDAWGDGLAYCLECGDEYTKAQAIIYMDVEHCPHCKSDYGKQYYYCEEHGSPDDDCERQWQIMNTSANWMELKINNFLLEQRRKQFRVQYAEIK